MTYTPLKTDYCRHCKQEIVWGKVNSEKGHGVVPLDTTAPVYTRLGDGKFTRARDAFVSHLATCAKKGQL